MNLKFGITYKTREKKEESNVEVDEYMGHYVNRGSWVEQIYSFFTVRSLNLFFDFGQLKVITLERQNLKTNVKIVCNDCFSHS